jgi:glycerol-3-phosphate acyltransferase PlsY
MNLNNGLITSINFTAEWQIYVCLVAFVLIGIVCAYLCGSINSAIIISKVLYRDDIRKYGSGNAGMTNMLRTFGGRAAVLTLLGDLLKTVLAIFITGVLLGFHYAGGISFGDGYCYIAGLFAMLGHIFPIYYGFKGGKGVLATATVALVLAPIPFLILFATFAAIVAASKYVSLGSVCAAILFPVVVNGYCSLLFGFTPGYISLSTILIAIIIVWCHRENLKRISTKTERKLSFKKKEKEVIATEDSSESTSDEQ